jgi:ribosome-associated protein
LSKGASAWPPNHYRLKNQRPRLPSRSPLPRQPKVKPASKATATVAAKSKATKTTTKPKATKAIAKPVVKVGAVKAPVKKVAVKKAIAKKTTTAKAVSKAATKASSKKLTTKTVTKAKAAEAKVIVPQTTKATSKKTGTAVNKPAGMPEQIRDIILRVLDDRQAEQVVSIDLRGRSSMADYLLIASGRAARQIAAIADMIKGELAKIGVKQVRSEGTGEGNWVLVDAGDVIVHLFRPEVRHFYNIEQIYGEDIPA